MSEAPNFKRTIVVGDGWGAIAAVAGLVAQGETGIQWLAGSGARLIAPLPAVPAAHEAGMLYWRTLFEKFDIAVDAPVAGYYMREFKNKSFREPDWVKAASGNSDESKTASLENLWKPDRSFAVCEEMRWSCAFVELEEALRKKLSELPSGVIFRHESVDGKLPIQELLFEQDEVVVVYGSGEKICGTSLIYADRWASLPSIQGIPKNLTWIRKREPMNVLQAAFSHENLGIVAAASTEAFTTQLNKDVGEEILRNVWGYFYAGARKSVWTVLLGADEGEDNSVISKKLRRIKQAVDKMFTGAEWVPQRQARPGVAVSSAVSSSPLSSQSSQLDLLKAAYGVKEPKEVQWPSLMTTVQSEQVRFEDSLWYAAGEVPSVPFSLSQGRMLFVTDGYGPAAAAQQLSSVLPLASN